MRCKVDDLCVVVNDLEEPRNNGGLVHIVRSATPRGWTWPVDWECTAVSTIRYGDRITFHPGQGTFGYRDCELRPIRDPGDDAVDQTLEWLDVPTKQGETA